MSKMTFFLIVFMGGLGCMSLKSMEPSISTIHYCFGSHRISFHKLLDGPNLTDRFIKGLRLVDWATINELDWRSGLRPLHVLAIHKDATIVHVKILLERGADPLLTTRPLWFYHNQLIAGLNPYDYSVRYRGETPPQYYQEESFVWKNFVGNRQVAEYLFSEILYRKLVIVEEQQLREDANRQKYTLLRY